MVESTPGGVARFRAPLLTRRAAVVERSMCWLHAARLPLRGQAWRPQLGMTLSFPGATADPKGSSG